MQRVPLSARVSADIDSAARAKATAEGVSLSAIVERALAEYLSQGDKKPAWAMDIERRVAQLEQQAIGPAGQRGKPGKRRR